MKLLFEDTGYVFDFKREVRKGRIDTWAYIFEDFNDVGANELISKAVSTCCPKDRFDRDLGRILALSRAMNNACFSRTKKLAFIEAYNKHMQKSAEAGRKGFMMKAVTA